MDLPALKENMDEFLDVNEWLLTRINIQEVQEDRIDKCDLMNISKRLHGITQFEDTAAKDKWLAVATEIKGQFPELAKLYICLI